MFLGTTEIGKAYLGSTLVFESGGEPGPVLPYDSKVEYIKFSGPQYINTLVYPTAMNLDIRYYSYSAMRYGWCTQGQAARVWMCAEGAPSSSRKIWWRAFSNSYQLDASTVTSWHSYRYDMASGFYMDGTQLQSFTASVPSGSNISSVPFYIGQTYDMRSNRVDTGTSGFDCRLQSLQIYQNSELVRDFIAVRVGQVGYLYDSVSEELFGNNGTGSFTLGQDII